MLLRTFFFLDFDWEEISTMNIAQQTSNEMHRMNKVGKLKLCTRVDIVLFWTWNT